MALCGNISLNHFHRVQLNGHIALACQRAFVDCTVPTCKEKVRREELAGHLAREATAHVDLLMVDRMSTIFNNVSYKMQ